AAYGARKGVGCRAACASGGRQRPACKQLPPAARSQGAVAHGALASGTVARGQPCLLRMGSDGNNAEGDKERASASF
ncbi:hypothetical protein B296_00051090, partial [Ensete ventricosum]